MSTPHVPKLRVTDLPRKGAVVIYHAPEGDVRATVLSKRNGRLDLRYSDEPDGCAPYASEGPGVGQWSLRP